MNHYLFRAFLRRISQTISDTSTINNIMTIKAFENKQPTIHPSCYIDDMAYVSGNTQIDEESSVWPMTVIRGDVNTITIGKRTNIQDGSILHVTHGSDYSTAEGKPLSIGDDVTIGHKAVLHACTIGNRCLIGMGAIILDGAIIEDEVIVGAGSLVSPNKRLDSGYLWLGSPAKKARALTDKEKDFLRYSAAHYVSLAKRTKACE